MPQAVRASLPQPLSLPHSEASRRTPSSHWRTIAGRRHVLPQPDESCTQEWLRMEEEEKSVASAPMPEHPQSATVLTHTTLTRLS
jgi:hypothetical protein